MNKQVKRYTMHVCDTQSAQIKMELEVRWPLWNMMYVMCTELFHCI